MAEPNHCYTVLSFKEENEIGYQIDAAYANADHCLTESENWHYWMNEAKRLENKLHGRS